MRDGDTIWFDATVWLDATDDLGKVATFTPLDPPVVYVEFAERPAQGRDRRGHAVVIRWGSDGIGRIEL